MHSLPSLPCDGGLCFPSAIILADFSFISSHLSEHAAISDHDDASVDADFTAAWKGSMRGVAGGSTGTGVSHAGARRPIRGRGVGRRRSARASSAVQHDRAPRMLARRLLTRRAWTTCRRSRRSAGHCGRWRASARGWTARRLNFRLVYRSVSID